MDIEKKPAGFWIRLSAFIIDFVCVWIPCIWFASTLGEYINIFFFKSSEDFIFVGLCILFLYHSLTIGKWGQSLGKFLAGISVVTKDGKKVSYLKSFGRTLLWYLYMLLLLFGCSFPFVNTSYVSSGILIPVLCYLLLGTFSQNKIFFYDYICGTRIVYKNPIGILRKTAVIIFGIVVLTAISYRIIYPPSIHPEKSRVAEALSVISNIKSAEERFLSRSGSYTEDFTNLDISYAGMTANVITTKFYKFSITTTGCSKKPCYVVTATRHVNNGTVAARYGLYSLNAIIMDRPKVQIISCPGGGANCNELID